jgi:hypothetical protein
VKSGVHRDQLIEILLQIDFGLLLILSGINGMDLDGGSTGIL